MDALCLEKRALAESNGVAVESQPFLHAASFRSGGLMAAPQRRSQSSFKLKVSQLFDSASQEDEHTSIEATAPNLAPVAAIEEEAPALVATLPGKDGLTPWEQFEEVVDMAQEKLEASGAVVSTEVIEGPAGWTVTAHVRPERLLEKREELLTLAKEALLQAADQLEGVYVLGYRTRPFTPLPNGFGATLASMSDPSRACWGTFSKGFCRNPETCRFQHPASRGAVNIALEASR